MTILLVSIFFMSLSANQFSGVFLFLVMYIYLLFNYNLLGLDLIKGDLWGSFGSDCITFYMVLLLLWVMSLVLILFYSWILFYLVIGLLLSMMIMFVSLDMVYLFIYFELSMIPMFLMILFLGKYKERYYAGVYLFIYTMISSMPMLGMLMIFQTLSGGTMINYQMFNLFSIDSWLQVMLMFLFFVKVPMFLVHIWLPKAHVEAPVFGSMILASVMLKMGGYGVIRCLELAELGIFISDFFFCFCLCSGVLVSYSCLYQVDLKVLVAYSSIIHMGIMLMGLFSGSELGYYGGLIMMLSHGICSSGMFYLANEIYEITGSRLLMLNKGLMSVAPMLSMMWVIMLINNLGVPPCFGIFGELFLLSGCLGYSFIIFIFFFLILFFVSCFVINMYSLLVGGMFIFRFVNVSLFSYYGGVLHLIPLNFSIFFISYL